VVGLSEYVEAGGTNFSVPLTYVGGGTTPTFDESSRSQRFLDDGAHSKAFLFVTTMKVCVREYHRTRG
jgi:hypothetical protein